MAEESTSNGEGVTKEATQPAVKVSNVAPTATVGDLYSHFGYAGTISSIHLQPGEAGGPGTAHIVFADSKAVDTALLLTDSSIKGNLLTVEAAEPGYVAPPDSKFYFETSTPPKIEGFVTVKGLAPNTTVKQIQDFFAYAGTIVVMDLPSDSSEEAFVGFSEKKALDNAVLLSDAKLNGSLVTVVAGPSDYKPSDSAHFLTSKSEQSGAGPLKQAQAALRNIVEKTVTLGASAISATSAKAKELDEKHQLTKTATLKAAEVKSTAAAAVGELQKTFAAAPSQFSRSLSVGTEQVSQSISNVDRHYQMTEKAQGVFALAEQRLNEVGNFFLQNKFISQGREFLVGTAAKVSEVVEGGPKTTPEVGLTSLDGSSSAAKEGQEGAPVAADADERKDLVDKTPEEKSLVTGKGGDEDSGPASPGPTAVGEPGSSENPEAPSTPEPAEAKVEPAEAKVEPAEGKVEPVADPPAAPASKKPEENVPVF